MVVFLLVFSVIIFNYIERKRFKNNSTGSSKNNLIKVAVDALLIIMKLLAVIKKVLGAFFVVLYKPLRKALSLFFYKVLVKLYSQYLRIIKRLGFKGVQNKFLATLNQKFVHLTVILMTILLTFANINSKANASEDGYGNNAQKTILADLITSEIGGFEEDEQLIVETFDQEAIISSTQQSYIDNLSGFKPQQKVSFDNNEALENQPDNVDSGSLVRNDSVATNITEQDRTETISYTVQQGDTISTIAEKFKISVSTILWENDLSAYSIIRPGDSLRILPTSGVNHIVEKNDTVSSIAKKYDVDESQIVAMNKLAKGSGLKAGQKILIPGGRKQTYTAPVAVTYTGLDVIKNIVTPTPSRNIKTDNIQEDDEDDNNVVEPGNKMFWPTEGHRITQYYSWRHYGLDIANHVGTPIYAADSGVVEKVGWGTGYGNQIVIDHGGGKKTRYAHLSAFKVKEGQKVKIGQQIGDMGSTGWSTGPHLHFEIIIDNKKYNPLNYIK